MEFSFATTEIKASPIFPIKFSFCTLTNNLQEYQEMVNSANMAGFDEKNSEFLYLNNSRKNEFEAYQGLNLMMSHARGEFLILCHQDILFNEDKLSKLEKCLDDLEKMDKNWAVAGNAGGVHLKKYAKYFVNGRNEKEIVGSFPTKVSSLDENFLILKTQAQLSFSKNLAGFHFYGTDICLVAEFLGYNCYVIDFLLTHKGKGNMDASFFKLKNDIIKKYEQTKKSRLVQTTCDRFYVSNSPLKNWFFNLPPIMTLMKAYFKLFKL